jgi:hypothetical protein
VKDNAGVDCIWDVDIEAEVDKDTLGSATMQVIIGVQALLV